MNSRFIIIAAFLFPAMVQAQSFRIDKQTLPMDSLQQVLPSLHDSARVDCLNELARSCIEGGSLLHADSSFLFAQQAYKEALKINYIKGLGDACVRYANVTKWYHWDFKKTETYYREAIAWYEKIQYDEGLGHAFHDLGDALLRLNSPDEAEKAFAQSLVYFRKTGNRVMLADLIDAFGLVYGAKGDFEKQFEYIKKGLREKRRIHDNRGMIWSFYRLAHVYQSIGDFETAFDYFRQSFRQAQSQSIPWRIYGSMGNIFFHLKNYDSAFYYYQKIYVLNPFFAFALDGMGRISLLRNEHDKALRFFREALAIHNKTGSLIGKIGALAEIGKTYFEMRRYKDALQYAWQSLATAQQVNEKEVLRNTYRKNGNEISQNVYEILWKIYDGLQKKDSAYFYFGKFVTLKDSLEATTFKLQHLQKLALYKVEAKEEQQLARIDLLHKDNQIKQQQLQKEALLKKILAASLAAFVLLGFILFRNIALKRKNEKHRRELAENELQIQKLESERTKAAFQQQTIELRMQALRAQMNPHFIFNSLNSINRFILKNQRREATEYLTKFSKLIRMILNSSASATVTLTEDLEALQLYMELESLRFEKKFSYQIQCDPDVDADFIEVPPLLLQPFIENAIWHGLMYKESKGHLWVNISQENEILVCTITDDGIGRKKAGELKSRSAAHKPMGMRITADRIAMIQQKKRQTSIQVNDLALPDGSAAGTEVIIKIPVVYD